MFCVWYKINVSIPSIYFKLFISFLCMLRVRGYKICNWCPSSNPDLVLYLFLANRHVRYMSLCASRFNILINDLIYYLLFWQFYTCFKFEINLRMMETRFKLGHWFQVLWPWTQMIVFCGPHTCNGRLK